MIEKAKESDVGHLASLAIQMWQAHTPEELEANFLDTMQRERSEERRVGKECRL